MVANLNPLRSTLKLKIEFQLNDRIGTITCQRHPKSRQVHGP